MITQIATVSIFRLSPFARLVDRLGWGLTAYYYQTTMLLARIASESQFIIDGFHLARGQVLNIQTHIALIRVGIYPISTQL